MALRRVAELVEEKREMQAELDRKGRVLARAKSFLQQYVEGSMPRKEAASASVLG